MELNQNMIQYLKCSKCQRFLESESYICELGHSICTSCGVLSQQCSTCLLYISDMKSFISTLKINTALANIIKSCFVRCPNQNCNRLFPLCKYEKHTKKCRNIPKKLSCILGCGIMTESLSKHLIEVHKYEIDESFSNNTLKIMGTESDWAASVWREKILRLSYETSVLICPKIDKDVFSLEIFNLNATGLEIKIKVKKEFNSITFTGKIPYYEEKLVKINDPIFWNCEIGILKNSFLQYDNYFEVNFLEIVLINKNSV